MHTKHITAFLLALSLVHHAAAQDWASWPQQSASLSPADKLAQLQDMATAENRQADYHYWLGVALLEAGKPATEAIDAFEHALLLDPDHAGAMYDYALLLCRLGQQGSCQAMLAQARARFGPPPGLAQQPEGWLVNGELRGQLGHSSNLNAGSQAGSIPLYLDGQQLELLLGDSSRAQAASYADLGMALQMTHSQYPGWSAAISLYQRQPLARREHLGEYRAIAGELRYQLSAEQQLHAQRYQLHDSLLGSLTVTGLGWQWLPQPSLPLLRLAIEHKQPDQGLPGYRSLRAEAETTLWPGITLRLSGERDQADPRRPGSGQQRWQLAVRKPVLLPGNSRLTLQQRWQYGQDYAAYSPFFGDLRRQSRSAETRLSLDWPLDPRNTLSAEWRHTRQHSKLALFSYRETTLSLGLSRRF